MVTTNSHLSRFTKNSSFSKIDRNIEAFQRIYPEKKIYKMGIGDTSQPLPKIVIEAFCKGATELGCQETYTGYGHPLGNIKLRETISSNYYQPLGIDFNTSEIFVSDGAQSDLTNVQELFGLNNLVALQNPMYPAFMDGNLLAGQNNIVYLNCDDKNNFIPDLPDYKVDLIYLCFPNNPTGAVATKEQLKNFVGYALHCEGNLVPFGSKQPMWGD